MTKKREQSADFAKGPAGETMWSGWKKLKPGDRVRSTAGWTGTFVRFPKAAERRGLVYAAGHYGLTILWDETGREGRMTRPGHYLRPIDWTSDDEV
jgi:hypothetical protein